MTDDIGVLAAAHYAEGQDPIEVAILATRITLDAAQSIAKMRAENPNVCPALPADLTVEYWSRRIIAELMEAGWRPPTEEAVRAAAEGFRERTAWYVQHRDDPCRCGHTIPAHDGEGGRCVDCETFDGTECWTWKAEATRQAEDRDEQEGAA